jgi:hypothetical protein
VKERMRVTKMAILKKTLRKMGKNGEKAMLVYMFGKCQQQHSMQTMLQQNNVV